MHGIYALDMSMHRNKLVLQGIGQETGCIEIHKWRGCSIPEVELLPVELVFAVPARHESAKKLSDASAAPAGYHYPSGR